MSPDNHSLLVEAKAHLNGLQALFCNMQDHPLEYLQPFEMVMLLNPVVEKISKVLDEGSSE